MWLTSKDKPNSWTNQNRTTKMMNTQTLENKASEYAHLLAKELENLSDYKSEMNGNIFV